MADRDGTILAELAAKYGLEIGARRGHTVMLYRAGTGVYMPVLRCHLNKSRNLKEAESSIRRVLRRNGLPLPGETPASLPAVAQDATQPLRQPYLPTMQSMLPAAPLPVTATQPKEDAPAMSDQNSRKPQRRIIQAQIARGCILLAQNGLLDGDVFTFAKGWDDSRIAEAVNVSVTTQPNGLALPTTLVGKDVAEMRHANFGRTKIEIDAAAAAAANAGSFATRVATLSRRVADLMRTVDELKSRIESMEKNKAESVMTSAGISRADIEKLAGSYKITNGSGQRSDSR